MAKINKVSAVPSYFKIKITVNDPECNFSLDSSSVFEKVIKANSEKTALKAAEIYCSKQMKEYIHTTFNYDPSSITPYFYPINNFIKENE